MSTARLQIERQLPAPPEMVFDALTQPRHLFGWWGPSPEHEASIAEVDLRVGGRYRLGIRAPTGTEYVVGGVFLEIERPSRLSYTWAWEHQQGNDSERSETDAQSAAADPGAAPEGPSRVTIELLACERGTRLVLTHERLEDQGSADGHREGWEGSIACLETYLTHPLPEDPT